EYLREHYSQHTLGVLAQKLNRSELGIVLKKRRLGLHKVDDFYTLQLLGELLLMDSHKVKWLVQQKYLKGRRAEWTMGLNKVWVVREEDVEAMLRQHPYVVHRPWRDLPESYARTVVEEEWRRDPWHNGPQAAKYAGVHRHTLNRFLNEGRLTGAQMSPDLKWSKWYVRQSVLDRLKEEMKKQEAARGERTSAAYRKTRPTKLSTRWSVPCSCGEPHMVEAPPKARGPDARALAQQQYHAEPALAESPERELVTA
ncbi:MAG: hypothetical protein Q8R28_05240, partial [Dehalococcoidia bacterium]|nr:hypothetical protein [Dehalococcoidia bacterium]